MDQIAGLDVSEKTKISETQRDSNPWPSSPYLLLYPVPSSLVTLEIKSRNVIVQPATFRPDFRNGITFLVVKNYHKHKNNIWHQCLVTCNVALCAHFRLTLF